jgi:hypothetical protein
VRFVGNGLVHLSDESNGPCAAKHDSDQLKMLSFIGNMITLAEAGGLSFMTEGHAAACNPSAAKR